MSKFDPNAAASADSGIFGLPFTEEESAIIYIPVPWEATTSYGGGTSDGPAAILEASKQVDLFDLEVERPYESGFFMTEESEQIRAWNREARQQAEAIIEVGGAIEGDAQLEKSLTRVNELGTRMNDWVREQTRRVLDQGKIAAIVGGDHSTPYGALQAIAEKHKSFGILHIDAHSDTRQAFEGFQWSHASIMHNVLENIPQVSRLVQVGIRDFCEEEDEYCRKQGDRVSVWHDERIAQKMYSGATWDSLVQDMIAKLPKEVWVSFDIDGLDQRYCPHTGTPVPGGLEFHQATSIFRAIAQSGRKIIGFDLNEVSPDPTGKSEWDANVGARVLYKLSGWTLVSQGKRRYRSPF